MVVVFFVVAVSMCIPRYDFRLRAKDCDRKTEWNDAIESKKEDEAKIMQDQQQQCSHPT